MIGQSGYFPDYPIYKDFTHGTLQEYYDSKFRISKGSRYKLLNRLINRRRGKRTRVSKTNLVTVKLIYVGDRLDNKYPRTRAYYKFAPSHGFKFYQLRRMFYGRDSVKV